MSDAVKAMRINFWADKPKKIIARNLLILHAMKGQHIS